MDAWIEDEFFTVNIPVNVLEEMKKKIGHHKSNGWYEFFDYGEGDVQATLRISFAIHENDIKVEGDTAKIRVQCKGTMDVDNEILRKIFLKEGENK